MSLIEYARPVENSCTYTSIVTNISNLFNIELTPAQLADWAAQCWFDWDWSLPNEAIKTVIARRNKTYPKNKVMSKMFTITQWLLKAQKWELVYIWFRFSTDMFHDLTTDWDMDKFPEWKTIWWHSCNIIYEDDSYYIIDVYKWLRTFNRYKIDPKYISYMISNKFLRSYCHIFYPTKILQIK